MSLPPRLVLIAALLLLLIGGLFRRFTPAEPTAARSDTPQKAARTTHLPQTRPGNLPAVATAAPPPAPLDYAGVTLPNRTVVVVSETGGRVTQVLARAGQAVRQGQPLAITDTQLKRLAVATAQAQLTQVRRQTERLTALAAEHNASVADLEQAQAQLTEAQAQLTQAQRHLADATVRSPATGILTERTVEPGAVLQPGTELGKLVDIATLKVRIMVPEQEVFRLRIGQTARLRPDALPGLTLTARISLIGVVADEVRAFPVELTLPNPRHRLRAGQSVQVNF